MINFKIASTTLLSVSAFAMMSQASLADVASAVDLTVIKIDVPIVSAPPGLPPFPARVDLPVSLSKILPDEPSDETWAGNNYKSSNSGDSGSHLLLARNYLAERKVVDGFQELKKALELNTWNADAQQNQALCHRMLGDILLEYALKAKDTGRGTKGMQRLLNAYIEYRQSVFLNPDDDSAKLGLVKATQEIAGIQPSFNNFLALASADMISGNKKDAEFYYSKCMQFGQVDSSILSPELRAELLILLEKLHEQLGISNPNVASAAPQNLPQQSVESPAPYVHHVQSSYAPASKSTTVQENDEDSKPENSFARNSYIDTVRRNLAREWHLSRVQTSKYPEVAFSVDKKGNISELRIISSSGTPSVDESALNVVRRVAPFPNAPEALGEMTYTFADRKETVDLSDYMHQLRRKIRHNWHPVHGLQEDHVIVSFKVSKDGTASNLQLSQASASAECNQANLQAIKDSSPFEHLPEGAPDSVDVQFHFDQDIVPGR